MFCCTIVLLALSLAQKAHSQIPIPCAGTAEMTARKCCPIPEGTDPGPCGVNNGRGSCTVAIPDDENLSFTNDARDNWPYQYFDQTCVCEGKYGGYDCGECDFGYTGDDCSRSVTLERKSTSTLTSTEWTKYLAILKMLKTNQSRYVVVPVTHTQNIAELIGSMVNVTHYDLFVWMHHFVAKDNERTKGTCMHVYKRCLHFINM